MALRTKEVNEILQEEFLRERAATLARAGEGLQQALEGLRQADEAVDNRLAANFRLPATERAAGLAEINTLIEKRNKARQLALLRRYYFIVIREALGLRCHHRVDEIFHIMPWRPPIQAPEPGSQPPTVGT